MDKISEDELERIDAEEAERVASVWLMGEVMRLNGVDPFAFETGPSLDLDGMTCWPVGYRDVGGDADDSLAPGRYLEILGFRDPDDPSSLVRGLYPL